MSDDHEQRASRRLSLRGALALSLTPAMRAAPALGLSSVLSAATEPASARSAAQGSATHEARSAIESAPSSARFPAVRPGAVLSFPRDHGAHPDYRTEWWYITAWLETPLARLGFQVTFFRSRTGHRIDNPSRFAPHQLVLAHAALADPRKARLLHAQRSARAGFGAALADTADTALALGNWHLRRDTDDRYRVSLQDREFAVELDFTPGAAPHLQGENGFSRKGPRPEQASYYYSRPQMAATGELRMGAQRWPVSAGKAWLDHEWSSEILDAQAVGWDWVGLNFDDGSALMAFRIRDSAGQSLWSSGRWIGSPSFARRASDPKIAFTPLRQWRSPRSPGVYPVSMRLQVDDITLELRPLFEDQELDARASTGGYYWEGAITVLHEAREVGRGYLELTGYAAPLRL